MSNKEFIQDIINKLGIDKEDNPEKIKLNNLDTNRKYQIELAKKLWNDKISMEDKFWYPEDYYYLEDIIFKKGGFDKLQSIEYGNIRKDELLKKDLKYGDWEKDFTLYFNKLDNKILVFVNYTVCKDKIWELTDSEHFIGIFDN